MNCNVIHLSVGHANNSLFYGFNTIKINSFDLFLFYLILIKFGDPLASSVFTLCGKILLELEQQINLI